LSSPCNKYCYKTALLYNRSFGKASLSLFEFLWKCYIIELPKERKRLKSSCSETSFSFNQPFLRAPLSPKERKRLKSSATELQFHASTFAFSNFLPALRKASAALSNRSPAILFIVEASSLNVSKYLKLFSHRSLMN